jgi:hypothetical protein
MEIVFSVTQEADGGVTGRFKTSHLWAIQNQPLGGEWLHIS